MPGPPSGTPIVLRAARSADAPVIATVWATGWADGHAGHVPDALLAFRTPESFAARVPARLAETTVAVLAGAVAGFTMVCGDEVEQVYVDAAARGSGVAAALLTDAERRVAAAGHARAWLAVVAGNTRARRFYERCGWADAGPLDYAAAAGDATLVVPCRRYEKAL